MSNLSQGKKTGIPEENTEFMENTANRTRQEDATNGTGETCQKRQQTRCLSLFSGGLDSILAVCILRAQGVHVEGVVFDSPFFTIRPAQRAARQLDLPLRVIDFSADILELVQDPPHGFGGHMNPCIDCHARMIRRAGERMTAMGFDCIATGEVLGQRPMSQNKQALGAVLRDSGFGDDVVRPLSAKLLAPSRAEREGLLDRDQLLGLSGRSRKPQIALAATFGIRDYPAPAGGCLLTDGGYCNRLHDLASHEGYGDRRLIDLLRVGRHVRLPGGTKCIIGRDKNDNDTLRTVAAESDVILHAVALRGPTVLLPGGARDQADLAIAVRICAAYGPQSQKPVANICVQCSERDEIHVVTVEPRTLFAAWLL